MDHDDPQQPIAEPAPKSAGSLTANLWNSLAMTFLMVAVGIFVVTYAVLTPYAYGVSTPTTAAVDHCEYRGSQGSRCWTSTSTTAPPTRHHLGLASAAERMARPQSQLALRCVRPSITDD
jgi:hypothetical protein